MDFCQKLADWVCCSMGIQQERSPTVSESHYEDIRESLQNCLDNFSKRGFPDRGDKKLIEEQGTIPGMAEIQKSADDSGSSNDSLGSESAPQPSHLGQKKEVSSFQKLQQLEEKAAYLYLQGESAESNGNLDEAIRFYKQAVRLVPRIDSIVEDFRSSYLASARRDKDNDPNVSQEPDGSPERADLTNKSLSSSNTGCSQPPVETRMTHISVIPVELVLKIFNWVVTDPDMKSLEHLALVCKRFKAYARESDLWKFSCLRVWGVNCGDPMQWNGSWRLMYINRPHLLFAGVYISKTSYVREGEKNLDFCYRPYHVVEYYRYMRFYVDGTVLIDKGIDKPADVIAQGKLEYCNRASVFVGHYRLCGDKVIITVPTQVTAQMNAHPSQQALQMELQISGVGRRHHNQLKWLHYSVSTTYRSSGQTVLSQIDLNDQFPPFHFLPVQFQ